MSSLLTGLVAEVQALKAVPPPPFGVKLVGAKDVKILTSWVLTGTSLGRFGKELAIAGKAVGDAGFDSSGLIGDTNLRIMREYWPDRIGQAFETPQKLYRFGGGTACSGVAVVIRVTLGDEDFDVETQVISGCLPFLLGMPAMASMGIWVNTNNAEIWRQTKSEFKCIDHSTTGVLSFSIVGQPSPSKTFTSIVDTDTQITHAPDEDFDTQITDAPNTRHVPHTAWTVAKGKRSVKAKNISQVSTTVENDNRFPRLEAEVSFEIESSEIETDNESVENGLEICDTEQGQTHSEKTEKTKKKKTTINTHTKEGKRIFYDKQERKKKNTENKKNRKAKHWHLKWSF